MATNTVRTYALQHLLQCQCCLSPMRVEPSIMPENDVYRCSQSHHGPDSSCAAPDVRARLLENWLIQDLSESIFTPQNIEFLRLHLAQAGYSPQELDPAQLKEKAADPLTYTAASITPMAQQLFAKLIDTITVNGTEATVHYSLPLPADGPLPEARVQTITLPAQVLT